MEKKEAEMICNARKSSITALPDWRRVREEELVVKFAAGEQRVN